MRRRPGKWLTQSRTESGTTCLAKHSAPEKRVREDFVCHEEWCGKRPGGCTSSLLASQRTRFQQASIQYFSVMPFLACSLRGWGASDHATTLRSRNSHTHTVAALAPSDPYGPTSTGLYCRLVLYQSHLTASRTCRHEAPHLRMMLASTLTALRSVRMALFSSLADSRDSAWHTCGRRASSV